MKHLLILATVLSIFLPSLAQTGRVVSKLHAIQKVTTDNPFAQKKANSLPGDGGGGDGGDGGGGGGYTCAGATPGSDVTIPCGGSTVLGAGYNSNYSYSWTPAAGLSSSSIPHPTANPTSTTTYTLTMTPKPNLLTNGSFEYGNTGFSSDYSYGISSGNYQRYTIDSKASNTYSWWCNTDPTQGTHMLVADGAASYGQRVWYQTVSVAPNSTYTFSGQLLNTFNSGGYNDPTIMVKINGTYMGLLMIPFNGCDWTTFSATWTSSPYDHSAIIEIYSEPYVYGDGYGNDFAMDNLVFNTGSCPITTGDVTVTIAKPDIYVNGVQTNHLDWCYQYETPTPFTLSTTATGSLQWYKNGIAIPGATSQTLVDDFFAGSTPPPSTNPRTWVYTVSNDCGTSDSLTIVGTYTMGAFFSLFYDPDRSHYMQIGTDYSWLDVNHSVSYSTSSPAQITAVSDVNYAGATYQTYQIGLPSVSSYPASFHIYFYQYEFSCTTLSDFTITLTDDGARPTFVLNSTNPRVLQKIIAIDRDSAMRLNDFHFVLYPNPATGKTKITANKPFERVQLFNTSGQLLKVLNTENKANAIMDVSALHSGSYIVKIISSKKVYTQKLIIIR